MKRKKLLYVGNALSDSGKTVTPIETLSSLLKTEGYAVIITSSQPNKAVRGIAMALTFLRWRREVDIVLIDTYSTPNFWYAVIIGRLCRWFDIPYIPILHGGNLPARLETHKRSCKKLFGGAMVNVAPSGYLYHAFAKAGFINIKHIPNTIEIKDYPFKKRLKLSPNLLWVRSFASIYNPQMALEVLQQLLVHYPKARLTMVGPDKDGSLEKCRAFAEKKGLPVIFTGALSKTDWITRAQDFDIFINTTNVDNTPVSIIEAMALGLVIVSTDVGGLPFLIDTGKNGILCPPNMPSQFVQKIETLLENPDQATVLIDTARLKAERFDWTVVKDRWREALL